MEAPVVPLARPAFKTKQNLNLNFQKKQKSTRSIPPISQLYSISCSQVLCMCRKNTAFEQGDVWKKSTNFPNIINKSDCLRVENIPHYVKRLSMRTVLDMNTLHTLTPTGIQTCIHTYIHTYIHMYIKKIENTAWNSLTCSAVD
jgi:hypothetical protein